MRLRPTYRPPAAARYRQPGGPWDVPPLDELLGSRPAAAGAALVDGPLRFDGEQVESMVAGLAGSLRRRGVRRGDVVTWQLPNWWEALVLYRACWRCGAVAAPLHHQVGSAEIGAMLDVLEPKVLLSAPALPLAARDDAVVVPVRGDGIEFETLLSGPPVTVSPNRPSDLAAVIFTSGSTGSPKAVLHTHRGLAYKARSMTGVHGLSGRDAVLMPAPLAHISGLLNAVLVPGAARMKTVLMERWDVGAGLGCIHDEEISFMIGPPSLFSAILDDPGSARPGWRACGSCRAA